MSKHAPGPYCLEFETDNSRPCRLYVRAGSRTLLASTEDNEQVIAQFSLFAAAPEMLAALEELLAMCRRQRDFNDDGDGRMFDRAEAAISKAKGEQS